MEVALALLLGAGGVLAGWYWRRRVAPRQTPMYSISEAPEAVVIRLVGTVRPRGETLVAPLSGKPCCYYEARATDSSQITPVAEEFRCVDFALDDGTGLVIIDAGYSEVRLAPDKAHTSWLTAATQEQVRFCEKYGYQGTFLSTQFQERRIEVGMTIAVIGYLDRHASGGGLRMRPFTITADNEWLHPEVPEARARVR